MNTGISPIRGNSVFFTILALPFFSFFCFSQTDATIFREFRFDFSTPGARANGMGRAFVGLSDEATAAYNNPAGISVLKSPEFSFEYRFDHNAFDALAPNDDFGIRQTKPVDTRFDLDRVGFASYAFSLKNLNISLFYVNNLDYRRAPVADETTFEHETERYVVTYINVFEVEKIQLNSMGFSMSRDFGKLDVGFAAAMTTLTMDFNYFTSLDSFVLDYEDLVDSVADHESKKAALVLGLMYEASPRLKFGLSYKRQPSFTYTEQVKNQEFLEERVDVPVKFKVPDSLQVGIAYQPSDLWTVLLDCEWVRYGQLVHDTTVLSRALTADNRGTGEFFSFAPDEYQIDEKPAFHLGAEYLAPFQKNILALRFGAFYTSDQKTRFEGNTRPPPPPASGSDPFQNTRSLWDVQEYIYNTDLKSEELGYTLGLGFVWHDRLQMDVAYVQADRFQRIVTSFLYRF